MTRFRSGIAAAGRGLVAISLLALLVVAVPTALWRFIGWPLPHGFPRLAGLGEPISDTAALKVVAVACWLAWAQLIACITLEAVAWARGRTPGRLPYARPAQRLAAWMVASLAMASWSNVPGPGPAHLVLAPAAAHSVVIGPSATSPAAPSPEAVPPTSARAAEPHAPPSVPYVVREHDSLWKIAGEHLGSPRRWPEIFELNKGHRQADGSSLEDPRQIEEGWTLLLPADAVGVQPDAAPGEREVVVMAGDSLSEIAEQELDDVKAWPRIFQLNRDRPQPDGRTLVDADLIRPGWKLRLPGGAQSSGAPEPATLQESLPVRHPVNPPPPPPPPTAISPLHSVPSPTSTKAYQPPAHDGPTERAHSQPDSRSRPRSSSPAVPVGLFGAGLLATGLVAVLDRLRRVQRRRRRVGFRLSEPDVALMPTETVLRAEADETGVAWLDQALRAMAAGIAEIGLESPPAILAVQLTGRRVELLLEHASAVPPPGFCSDGEGWMWTLHNKTAPADLEQGADWVAPLPALVHLGDTDGGRLLVDLETAGSIAVVGAPECTASLLRSIALQLSTSLWADHLNVILVDLEMPELAMLEWVDVVANFDEAIERVELEAQATMATLESEGFSSTFVARTRPGTSDGWCPLVVVCARPPDPAQARRLVDLAGNGGRGFAVVFGAEVPSARWQLVATDGAVAVVPLGLSVRPQQVSEEDALDVTALLDAASDHSDQAAEADDVVLDEEQGRQAEAFVEDSDSTEGSVDEPYASDSTETPEPVLRLAPEGPGADILPEVEVRILGPVEVVGGQSELAGTRGAELVAYLATHPSGIDADRLKARLWPPHRLPASKTLSNTVSSTRKQLGLALDGSYHLPVVTNEIYRLAGSVGTDLDRFEALVRRAKGEPQAEAIVTLREALAMVRGRPYEAVHGFDWAQVEGLVATTEAVVADAAHWFAELCLEAGDHRSAEWGLGQGLLASPGHEALYRDRMIVADAAGNPAAVKAVMAELCQFIDALEPYDEIHPETAALYERLSRRRLRRVAG